MRLDDILPRFDNARRNGDGYIARCPSHEDDSPSLRLKEGNDGTVLVRCGAGCNTESVLHAVGLKMRDLFQRPGGLTVPKPASGERREYTTAEIRAGAPWSHKGLKVGAVYDYTDEQGQPLILAVRLVDRDGKKTFRQARRVTEDRWRLDLNGARRVLYRLQRVLQVAGRNGVVHVVEGEKDVHTLEGLGLVATTCPMGAGKWLPEYSKALVGASVVILPDNDDPGRKHAADVAKACAREQIPVRILNLPGLPDKGDVTDWLSAGHTRDELLALIESAPPAAVTAEDLAPPDGDQAKGRPSVATRLFKLAIETEAELFRGPDDETYATVKVGSRVETMRLGSTRARDWLRFLAYHHDLGAASNKSVDDALKNLEARARFGGTTQPVHVRVAEHEGKLYLDLANDQGEAVEVSPDGWKVLTEYPVRFIRPKGLHPLPRPEPGAPLSDLRRFLNVEDAEWPLVAAWLLAAARPTGPYAVLAIHGEQGSAKSTACKLLKRLLDPSLATIRRPPKDERDLFIAAKNGWMLSFDNLSHIDADLSDALCCVATGSGFATRELHSNDDESLFQASRPILLNGISEGKRSDLLDRSVVVSLPAIAPEARREESAFWPEFDAAHPRLLGAICSALATALKNLPHVKLESASRMIDFERWGVAAEEALGLSPGQFQKLYAANRRDANSVPLEVPFAQAIIAKMRALAEHQREMRGTASDLLTGLEEGRSASELTLFKSNGWPKTHAQVGEKLRRLAPNLRMAGVNVTFGKSGSSRSITITRLENFEAGG